MVECRKVLAEYQGKPASASSIEIADQASAQLEVMWLVCLSSQSACLPVHSSISVGSNEHPCDGYACVHVYLYHTVCIIVMECTHLFLVVAAIILHDGCAHVHVYLYCVPLCFCVVSRAYTAISCDSNERPLWWLCL